MSDLKQIQIQMNNLTEEQQKQLLELVKIGSSEKEPVIERAKKGESYCFVNEEFYIDFHTEGSVGVGEEFYIDFHTEGSVGVGEDLCSSYNYFTGVELATRVSLCLRNNFLFIRKAIEFANGYKFKVGERNYSVNFDERNSTFHVSVICTMYCRSLTTVYMSMSNAERFAEWCNEHKNELGVL